MKRNALVYTSFVAACFATTALCTLTLPANAADDTLPGKDVAEQVEPATTSASEGAAMVAQKAIDYYLPAMGKNAPDWAKRIEFNVDLGEHAQPHWSILTVQPLHQSDDKEHTVFTQISQQRYQYLGTDRDVTNIGFGYRKLFNDFTVLAGVNTFFDYEWDRKHKRAGLGGELKWSGLDFTANKYFAISDKTSRGLNSGTFEEVLDGYDIELGAQVPFLPWMKVYGKRYVWDTKANSDNIKGWTGSIEADVHQNVRVEAGISDDNFTDGEDSFLKMTYHLPLNDSQPVATSNMFIADSAWEMRDMREHTLRKVRRENKIILERTSSGVVITRGN